MKKSHAESPTIMMRGTIKLFRFQSTKVPNHVSQKTKSRPKEPPWQLASIQSVPLFNFPWAHTSLLVGRVSE